MTSAELTGIERQLVLQYLIDGNVPVTVTELPENKKKSESESNHYLENSTNSELEANLAKDSKLALETPNTLSEEEEQKDKTLEKFCEMHVKPLVSGVFPVAIRSEQMTVLDQGIIVLQNPPETVKSFDGKIVRVQFYFNRLGLYFDTQIKSIKSGALALAIPKSIKKVEETAKKNPGEFNAVIYIGNSGGDVKCGFSEDYPLFCAPKWSDVEESEQQTAKKYLEAAVMHARSNGTAIGNGLHLISVCRYLAHEPLEKSSSIEGRKNPPEIIYIDAQRIVFASNSKDMFLAENCEYALILGFPIKMGPIKERTIYADFCVQNIFYDDDKKRACAVCNYVSIKEEDVRFLEDKKI